MTVAAQRVFELTKIGPIVSTDHPSASFDEAFVRTQKLIDDFRSNEPFFLSPQFSEQAARKDFIDKLFIALGWDVNHHVQKNPYEQEVTIERGVVTGAAKRRADYAFSLSPHFNRTLFFVEAKKPQSDIAIADNYFQAIRYAWSNRHPLVVLTDFNSVHIIDSRFQPDVDTALNRKVKTWNYQEFASQETFAEFYYLFSREAVANNSIEKFAATMPRPKGRAVQLTLFKNSFKSIDELFLEKLDGYRSELANSFHQKNPALDGSMLTEIVQRTLDRLVFVRFLEDKLIEPKPIISQIVQSDKPWRDFVSTSQRLDSIYNGIVFKPHAILDSANFRVDNRVFSDICKDLSDPQSPYDFNNVPISILGSIYERFLGKVIVVDGKEASVTEKPEVRKAGGVYYTPEIIVSRIVENTIGRLIDGKAPEAIRKMRFADIACGSGSFLIGVYDYLLRHYASYYNANPGKVKPGDCVDRDGVLHLSLAKKREILLTHIHGVDIDHQAVEVAQLSLYLRLLQEETTATANNYQHEIHQAILPSLNRNIVCGNSLIDPGMFSDDLFPADIVAERRINAMDFRSQFPTIAREGGFDAIVGNPPYIRIQVMKEWAPLEVGILRDKYLSTQKGNYDVYVAFVERGLSLLNKGGRLGFILPHKFFNAKYGAPLRNIISERKSIHEIVHFGDFQIFAGATTYTSLLFLTGSPNAKFTFRRVDDLSAWATKDEATSDTISAPPAGEGEWNFVVGEGNALFKKLQKIPDRFGDHCNIFVGLQTSADDVYIMDVLKETKHSVQLYSKALRQPVTLENALLHPLVSGTDVDRYAPLPKRQVILFPYFISDNSAELIKFDEIEKKYPKIANYLLECERKLRGREKGKFNDDGWYRFGRSQNLTKQEQRKICVPRLVDELHATMDESAIHFLDNVDVGGVTLKDSATETELYYVLGLLNSTLLRWYFPFISAPFRGGFRSANRQFLEKLPIVWAHAKQKSVRTQIDKVALLARKRFALATELSEALSDRDRAFFEAKVSAADRQIDDAVFKLYGLTEEEIQLVESSVAKNAT
ncbi:hypothetical protein DIE21_36180 [Burkholderia sp. Bp9140]|uniref:Eco57I restriction-modification methylase domain-containing protein n=1 Tax=Burkholderia sp. Bp9140 TaxID=2184572 RepID=UPI000F56D301|nr:N-6 DNA methylase [Burkholderia sp. Bp9140]RQR43018.1 hypothetical protein DIE21_36180 [Burkholderia sp. Bp9140]